jgi:hypothetical protein
VLESIEWLTPETQEYPYASHGTGGLLFQLTLESRDTQTRLTGGLLCMLDAYIAMDFEKDLPPGKDIMNAKGDEAPLPQTFHDNDSGDETRLCAYCQNVCNEISISFTVPSYPHYDSILLLEESANAGCTMCAQFLASTTINGPPMTKEEMEPFRLARSNGRWGYQSDTGLGRQFMLSLYFFLWHTPGTEEDSEHTTKNNVYIYMYIGMVPVPLYCKFIYLNNASASKLTNYFKDRTASGSDSSCHETKESLTIASQWLKVCRESHDNCNKHVQKIRPSRLVSTNRNFTRVVLRNELEGCPAYATLSHCWGKAKFDTLKIHNLDTFREQIPEKALSQTFKDAIIIAQEFGIPYIWIDSLCIVQDDKDDWTREAASMSTVYGGSTLNIAASGASDGTQGCFFKSTPTIQCRVSIKCSSRTILYQCIPRGTYDIDLMRMPLMKRGWALQERILPPRTLHFTSTQLFWECYENVACEMFPQGTPEFLREDYLWSSFFHKKPLTRSMWSSMVSRYSGCDLTLAEDKLTAISGLAHIIQSETEDEYVAGMWRKDLEVQLCWYILRGRKYRKTAPYIAPTWSWASLDDVVRVPADFYYQTTARDDFVNVLDIQLQPAGTDPLGQLASANLRLGCVFLLRVTFHFDQEQFMTVANELVPCVVYLDEGGSIHQATIVPIFNEHEFFMVTWGLILEPTNQKKGQYRRQGVFQIFDDTSGEQFKKASMNRSCWEDNELVDIKTDESGRTLRVIDII